MKTFIASFMVITWFMGCPLSIHAETMVVPKETYMTYAQFLADSEKKNKPSLRPNANWIAMSFVDPLIAKYRINESHTLLVSRFSGDIGSKLANLNRWRKQLALPPVTTTVGHVENWQMGTLKTTIVRLNNNQKHMLVYWIDTGKGHFFNKVIGNSAIDESAIKPFIEGQPWDRL